MKKDQALNNENRNELKIIVEQELMPHVDHNYSALFVLGNNVKTLPKDKIEEFAEVFKDYLMATYAISLGYYNNQMVEFEPTKPYDGKKLVSIKALIKEAGRKDINVIFQVRQNKMGQWKAIDMTAEGVSLIQTKRAEFTPMIRQKGIDSVIALMKEKSDKQLENKPKKIR
jgi:phospholipid transport system substrate-binding protein